MFTRKLVVIIVPLLLVALLCQVFPLFDSLGFFSNVIQGALVGAALALQASARSPLAICYGFPPFCWSWLWGTNTGLLPWAGRHLCFPC